MCKNIFKLESLLAKNYNLYRSATNGYRAYLQSYASYSLKKIFDVNSLDLTKIAKAFGFKVPPRVNLAIGPGNGVSSRVGEKRRREEEDSGSEEENDGGSGQAGDGSVRGPMRGKGDGKARRIETVGQKAVEKEKYRKAKHGSNWSR